jgi:uncharacterized protein with HEPN domain
VSQNQDQRYLSYLATSIELIERRIAGMTQETFISDLDTQDAVLWRLETLGEATGKLSDELKARHPHVRWRAIYGFRNIAAHGYLELNLDLVWEIITTHLDALKAVTIEELARPDNAGSSN